VDAANTDAGEVAGTARNPPRRHVGAELHDHRFRGVGTIAEWVLAQLGKVTPKIVDDLYRFLARDIGRKPVPPEVVDVLRVLDRPPHPRAPTARSSSVRRPFALPAESSRPS